MISGASIPIAANPDCSGDFTNKTAFHQLFCFCVSRVFTRAVQHGISRVRSLCSKHLTRFAHIYRRRLIAHNVLAPAKRLNGNFSVSAVRSNNANSIVFAIARKHFIGVGVNRNIGIQTTNCLLTWFVSAANTRQLQAGNLIGPDNLCILASHAAKANNCNAHVFHCLPHFRFEYIEPIQPRRRHPPARPNSNTAQIARRPYKVKRRRSARRPYGSCGSPPSTKSIKRCCEFTPSF